MSLTPISTPLSNNNKNALFSKYSRYVAGGTTERSSTAIEWWERYNFEPSPTDIVYAVENIYEGRLDLIASVFYGEARWWWFIAQYNNILDPFSEVVPGRVLLIPTQNRLALMIGKVQGGLPSTRESPTTISPIIT